MPIPATLDLWNISMQEIQNFSSNAQFMVFAAIFLLVGISRQVESERIALFLRSFTNGNLVDQQLRQERAFSRVALLAFTFVVLTVSLFLSLAAHHFGRFLDFDFFGLFVSIIVLIFIITTMRVAIYAFLAWLFELDRLQQQHTYHWLLTNVIGCLLILPLSVIIQYGPSVFSAALVPLGLSLLVIINVIRVVRTMLISMTSFSISIGYYFLYICALEILPLVLCTTVVLRQIGG